MIAGLQARYAEETGIRSLKIRHNNVLGYYVEVTAGQAQALDRRRREKFIHRQTMASAMRFTTTELGALEQKIASAAERALADRAFDLRRPFRAHRGGGVGDPRRRARARRDRRRGGARRACGARELCAAEGRRKPCLPDRGRTPPGRRAGAEARAARALSRTTAILGPSRLPRIESGSHLRMRMEVTPGASGCSPGRTWRGNRRSCARTR